MRLLALVFGIAALDQMSKLCVQMRFLYAECRTVIPGFFNLHYIRNEGAAWGMFAGWRLLLILFSLAMLLLMLIRQRDIFLMQRFGRLALGLLVGGIIGNLIDRIRLGYVVDFLDFHGGAWHFPAFNVADSAICIGIGLYLLGQFMAERQTPTAHPSP